MKALTVTHICTGCGKTRKLNPNKRHWCDCNPQAKFRMMIEKDYRLAHQIVKAAQKTQNAAQLPTARRS